MTDELLTPEERLAGFPLDWRPIFPDDETTWPPEGQLVLFDFYYELEAHDQFVAGNYMFRGLRDGTQVERSLGGHIPLDRCLRWAPIQTKKRRKTK
ncbi:hypothetical protein [Sutterella sp.]|uniref:hypothetical protein n=1 Tax=Sutterella sp. TaxID=1981025 RepID=UPI0026DF046F|nr:hypothetical protein [Sutterella sp.]MDO5531410.1 hypothetical protein [Sutterella sp.]